MHVELPILIDANSWTNIGRTVPTGLNPLSQTHSFNIFNTMLRLGVMTTPVRARGLSLNSFWAFIRYFGALAANRSMRISSDFYNLDPHQKTILSDDFGVAFSIEFLRDKLGLRAICDGRYFMQHFAAKLGMEYALDPSVHGSQKCPDYICVSNDGKIHLIECKGTQSSRAALLKQIERGREQKNSILVTGPRAGERIVSGLLIRKDTARQNSELFISDPIDSSPSITISEEYYTDAESDIIVGGIASRLTAAGFEDTSFFLSGRLKDDSLMRNGGAKYSKKEYHEKPYNEEELNEKATASFTIDGKKFSGRMQEFILPKSFTLLGERKSKAIIKAGIKEDLLKSLRDQRDQRSKDGWPLFSLEREFQALGASTQRSEKNYGEIVDHGIYASTIEFQQ